MNNSIWQIVGMIGVVGFGAAIVLTFVARRLFVSSRERDVNLGLFLISAIGGASSARAARADLDRRRTAH